MQQEENPLPPIGILIPTYKRPVQLIRTLQHLEAQTWMDFEVVVVDDGSLDDTLDRLERYRSQAPFSIRVESQPNSGPAAARNRGIRMMRTPITLMIGDDTYPVPELVRLHTEYHLSHPGLKQAAVGHTPYGEREQVVTPFMRWLYLDGIQFAYRELLSGATPDWKYFYTSNLSVKTDYLRTNPFHEGFITYGIEDIELGYRLHKEHGLEMTFLRDAVAEHVHPVTFDEVCRRAVGIGVNAHHLAELWPEHRRVLRRPTLKRQLMAVMFGGKLWPVVAWVGNQLTRVWCPPKLVTRFINFHHDRGYAKALHAAEIGHP